MITSDKLRIYQRYEGDIDGFSRAGDPGEASIITYEDWHIINLLWHRLALERSVPCAESFYAETRRLLSVHVADAAALAMTLDYWALPCGS